MTLPQKNYPKKYPLSLYDVKNITIAAKSGGAK
jgi:hypothetical protein